MLRLDGERLSIALGNVVSLPQTLEQVQPHVATQRFLYHLAVTATRPGRPHLHRLHDGLIDRERGTHLGHYCRIIAPQHLRHHDATTANLMSGTVATPRQHSLLQMCPMCPRKRAIWTIRTPR